MNDDLYKGKYRTQTIRFQNWDYSSSGWYFVTICIENKENLFGYVMNKQVVLTELGHYAAASWLAMERVFKVLKNDVWVIMPNHTHFLFKIDNPKEKYEFNEFGKTIKNSVSSIINHFKGRVTKYKNKENIEFEWQKGFYEHIVRDEYDFKRIQNYIVDNPTNWGKDKFYKK
ncbi:MAG: transposase [Bacteroidales bacterium]|nr:transposase [Bacteroidales bacterium]